MKRSILTTAAIFAALLFVGSANAGTYYFIDQGSGNWNDTSNWFDDCLGSNCLNAVPDASARAVICSGETCNVDITAAADTLAVQDGATLNIQASRALTLENDNDNLGGGAGNDHSNVDGTINLESSGGQYGKLEFTTNDHDLEYSDTCGSIVGEHHNCQILLSSNNLDLTSSIMIEGALTITAYGGAAGTTFINDGYVHADIAGTLEIDPDQIGVSSGVWCVSTSESAILRIDAPSAGKHDGNVSVSNGVLDINETFATSGNLIFVGGVIDVASGTAFSCDGDNPRAAGTYYFYVDDVGTAANGNNPFNWYTGSCESRNTQDGQIPSANDRVVICSGQECNVTENTTWDTMDVCGTLNIQPGCTLTLENDNDNFSGGVGDDHSLVDGTVNLMASGGQYGTLAFTTNDHELEYSGTPGSIVGADLGCQITLGSDYLDLTSGITIRGALAIVESGSPTDTCFINDYEVEADVSGTLELAVDYLDDGSNCTTGDWAVSAAGAVLKFTVGSTKLSGEFVVSNGMLDVDDTVYTEGNLELTNGTVSAASGVSFKTGQDCGCSE